MPRPLQRALPWAALAALALWALRAFLTPRLVGSGDSRWYAMMLADWVTQARAHVFPVWIGQTEYAFNGAVSPVREAPLYLHWSGILDLLTLHRLGFLALQNLTVVTLGLASIGGAYAALLGIAPRERLVAAFFAALYFLCPAHLALVATFDLQMTWAAMPFLPWLFGGLWRMGREPAAGEEWRVAWPLAALWWAHPPTALWATLASAPVLAWVWLRRPAGEAAAGAARLGAWCAPLAAYSAAGLVSLRLPGKTTAAFSALAEPQRVMASVTQAFPQALLPVTRGGDTLGDLQLGYALWLVLAAALGAALWRREGKGVVLGLGLALLAALVLPVPGFTAWAWRHMPGVVARITFYWPMQRIYPVVAAGACVLGFAMLTGPLAGRRARAWVVGLLGLGVLWSAGEAGRLAASSVRRRAAPQASARSLLPENRLLSRYAYSQFPDLPRRFSAGVAEPWNEFRLADPASGRDLGNRALRTEAAGSLEWGADAPGVWLASPALTLEPGRDYLLELGFPREDYAGLLQIAGERLYREYALPRSGGPGAFGCAPGADREIAIRIGGGSPDEVRIRFIPGPGSAPGPIGRWTYRLKLRDPASAGAELVGLLPAAVRVTAERDSLLLTPRMYLKGYAATVDGQPAPVGRRAGGEAAVPVRAGTHDVVLKYHPPAYLVAGYWVSLGTALAGFAWAAVSRRARAAPPAAGA